MTNNPTPLPEEVVREIEEKAKEVFPYLKGSIRIPGGGTITFDENSERREAWIAGATEYAVKLQEAKELLKYVYETTTDKSDYYRIKKFLYGE